MDLIGWAIPFFGAFILWEYWYIKRHKKYIQQSLEESISNLQVGIAERFFDICTTGAFYWVFVYLYDHFRITTIEPAWYWWVFLLVITDLLWYWYHRIGHKVNLFWAAHVVHHQSEEFNFTVAARITVLQAGFRCVFWAFLPVLGFSPHMVTVILLLHGAYPFFTHTETIGKLGWLEYILVTPSHHRVHHSSNEAYLDKNFSDIFIIWDKIFGTFVRETEKPVYGLTQPLKSHSFLWQHFHFFLEMGMAFRKAVGWKAKLRVVFGGPDELDPANRDVLARWLTRKNTVLQPSPFLKKYVLVQTMACVGWVFVLVSFHERFSTLNFSLGGLLLLVTLIISGAIMEQRRWIFHLEAARLFILTGWLLFFFPFVSVWLGAAFSCILVLRFYRTLQDYYESLLFYKA